MEPILVAKNLSKKYGKVVALESANLELYPGEVLGVIGDNGAGKSTLIKVLCGAVIPDSGEILLDGKPVTFTSPIEASMGEVKVTGLPSNRISPLSGITAPHKTLISVDFPAPLSPITPNTSPGYNSKLALSKATTFPYFFDRFFATKIGSISLRPF